MKLLLILAIVMTSSIVTAAGFNEQFTLNQQVAVSVTGTAALVLSQSMRRGYLMVQNNGSQTVYVKLGSTISGSEGIVLIAGASYEFTTAPTDSVYMKSASGTQSVVVIEGNTL